MRNTLTTIFTICSLLSFAQDTQFRFQLSAGLTNRIYFGKSMERLSAPANDYTPVYQTEVYNVRYKSPSVASGFYFQLGYNLLEFKKWKLRLSASASFEIYSDKLSFELTDIGNGDTIGMNTYLVQDVPLGYKGEAVHQGIRYAADYELMYLRKLPANFSLGLGIVHRYTASSDHPDYYSEFSPLAGTRQALSYSTSQLGLAFQIEKQKNNFGWYLNVNQAFLTTKRTKGAPYFDEGYSKYPLSQNLDFRFPLMVRLGASLNFGKK
jgi:hypothetical protein